MFRDFEFFSKRHFVYFFFFFFAKRNFIELWEWKKGEISRTCVQVDNNCEIIVYRTISNVVKGDFFPPPIRLLFDPFTPVQSAKPMTRTVDVKTPRIPASNLFYLKSDYINDRKTSTLYSYTPVARTHKGNCIA